MFISERQMTDMSEEMNKQEPETENSGRNEKQNNVRYAREGEVSASSRYSRAETFRTGSRYGDKEEEAVFPAEVLAEDAEGVQGILLRLRHRDPVMIALLIALMVFIAGYVTGVVVFGQRYYPGTGIAGINCSMKKADWVRMQLHDQIDKESFVIGERDSKSEILTASQIGLHYVDDGALEQTLARQYSILWPVMMFVRRGQVISGATAYDHELARQAINELSCMQPDSQIAPADAYLGETQEGYVVVPEVMGTTLRADECTDAIIAALDAGEQSVSLEEAGCYVDPVIYSDNEELVADTAKRNALLGADITLDFADRQEEVNAPVIMGFIVPDGEGGYRIDPDEVWLYVSSLADTYDTFGRMRTFETTTGKTVTLYGGDYGWAMDQDATAGLLYDRIEHKAVETIEPIYAYTAKSRETNDIGGTYVEICIEEQNMWCYQDWELVVDTPVVTGNPSKNNATPSGGVWSIDAKMRDYVLIGEGYRSPVDYWMPFNGNIGIHDMQSRYWFGSTIYLTNGSHGCINTPLDAVAQIYDIVSIGTPVIVYD